MRGGRERPSFLLKTGVALAVGVAILASKDSGVAMAGGCIGQDNLHPFKETKNYEFSKVVFVCDGEEGRDPADSNVIRVTSKTRFLGIPFLRTTDGAEEGLKFLESICTVFDQDKEPKIPKRVYLTKDVVVDEPDCTTKLS